ncbi:hypothetical protein GI374_11025 [Paracoccus sp. S-4012]|uniref:DUF6766 family protein n=1 Tax=Paracoccus sp. S-4012 TaxID=2665648 RepID=UPI0012B09043|nr:DUF6766 family protein [Paracoccus sp. S-4012]MRX50968.1 hypothetical protein [Paracoccus sp. S-4012]
MKKFLRDSGLSWALLALFLVSLAGMIWSGWLDAAEEARRHAEAAPSLGQFLTGGDFLSPLFENWESEFLQMAFYVVLTAMLFQRGSAESSDPDDPDRPNDEAGPGIGGWLYAHSLGLTLAALFVASFVLHGWGSWQMAIGDAARHGEAPHGFWAHLGTAGFWFESMQNWQSEFLATLALVVLSIFLRHRGSPESKPVQAPHGQTGAG